MEIESDIKLQEWLDNIQAREATREVYTGFLKIFCECVGLTPSQLLSESIGEIKAGLMPAERKCSGYLANFKKCLIDKGYAPKSFNTAIASVRSFYKAYDIPLPNAAARTKKALPERENNILLTKDEVKNLITNAKSLRERAIILCMATSGMGRQEIINLRMGDISFDAENIGTVSIRRDKETVDFVTFISPEATIALRSYWAERNRDPVTKTKGADDFVFVTIEGTGIAPKTFVQLFSILGKELGYQKKKGDFVKSRGHGLRKFFASTLEDNGCPKAKIDFMLGHTPSGNDLAYFHRNTDKLKELYKLFVPFITFEKKIELRSFNTEDTKRLEELINENQSLKDKMERQALDFKIQIESLERKIDVLSLLSTGGDAEAWEESGNIAVYKGGVKVRTRKPVPVVDYPLPELSDDDRKRASEFMNRQNKMKGDMCARGEITSAEKATKLKEELKKRLRG